ncbi:hypothetical protein N803_08795 [Knoellia subterranea KCTC 19937]|uniref:Acyltransferase 3 domain-containing protein n=2 Tax=Knoellia TaxID=136099 RepID=A0A0A0JS40_9MICO|nr:hypothetical protein N803_08795 [Knoellia subterranea KCTC 19937]
MDALDGIRGLTIILVVLGHLWIVYPKESLDRFPIVRAVFNGGAVTMFFVIGGFIVTRNLLRENAEGRLDPFRFYLRRIVRLGVQLVPLALAILVLARYDDTDTSDSSTTIRSVLSVLTFTWNNYLIDHALEARSELGHLWYLSVQQQVYLAFPIAVLLLSRWRRALGLVFIAAGVGVIIHRFVVLNGGPNSEWAASLSTFTRADGLFLGAALACLAPWIPDRGAVNKHVANGALVALGLLIALLPELGSQQYLREWSVVYVVVATLLVAAVTSKTQRAGFATTVLQRRTLVWLGNASLSLYVWHFPIFWTVSHHTPALTPLSRTFLSLGLLAAVTVISQRFIEAPTRRWLRTSSLFRTPALPTSEARANVK